MKKIHLALLLITAVLFSSCVEEPEFKGFSNFKLDKYNNNVLLFNVDLLVNNPNKFGIKVKKSFLDVYIGDSYLGKGKLTKAIKVKRKRESNLTIPVELALEKGAMFKLMRLATARKATLRVEGVVRGSAMGIPKRVKVNKTKEINIKDLGINFGSLLGN
jgi:LEA14-like dessication related protein